MTLKEGHRESHVYSIKARITLLGALQVQIRESLSPFETRWGNEYYCWLKVQRGNLVRIVRLLWDETRHVEPIGVHGPSRFAFPSMRSAENAVILSLIRERFSTFWDLKAWLEEHAIPFAFWDNSKRGIVEL